jgi:AAA ATPase domain
MDPVRNPFAPGAGSQPPELAGRKPILEEAKIAIQRAVIGRHNRSQMLLGLRGVGKTVLLNKIQEIAEAEGHLTSFIEAPEGKSLSELLLPKITQTLRKLSTTETAKFKAHQALKALKSFASVFQLSYGDLSIAIEPETGVADSGNLESDLPELFLRVGEAAKAASKGWTLLIDEVQYLRQVDLAALIVALHKTSQKELPVLFFGAGLPQVAALSGDAKSYAERLFHYPPVGPLQREDAKTAIRQPVEDEGVTISNDALNEIFQKTRGYPYFLQEWGYQCWNLAQGSEITEADAIQAAEAATRRLDDGFFKVRFDRLTPKEREYVIAMAQFGGGPYRSADVADALKETPQSLGPRRSKIIEKGMIYSPSHGDIAFTVPMFNDYLMRHFVKNADGRSDDKA